MSANMFCIAYSLGYFCYFTVFFSCLLCVFLFSTILVNKDDDDDHHHHHQQQQP